MKLGAGNPKQTMMAVVLGVFALGGIIYAYEELFATDAPVPSPAPVAQTAPVRPAVAPGGAAKQTAATNSAALDPTLHMDAMLVSESVVYSGAGRNIFSPHSAPPVSIPKPISTARMAPLPPPQPCPPNCRLPALPPPIDLKLFGVETAADGARKACLLHDDNVYLASAGEVVLRRYKVISVDAKSIQVEDMQNNNRQTLPLLAN